jgi:hypothetical protein
MDLISPAHNATLRNNIFQGNGYSVYEVVTGSTGHDWSYDNWYTTHSPRFKWENKDYASIVALCAATGFECNGHESLPELSNPGGGDFNLLPSSPNIDRGIPIPGINDGFTGNAPDIGRFEHASAVDTPPVVLSILRADLNPTSAASVDFSVAFSEPVTGVEAGDFFLASSASISGAAVSAVSGSGHLYTVSTVTGAGDGTLRLDVLDDDSIRDAAGQPLGGTGTGNGNFSTGEEYSVMKSSVPTITETFRSNGRNDGWVLESGENTNRGGSFNAKAASFLLGDDKGDRQYRAILDFPTATLPDNTVITKAMVMIKAGGLVGTNPFLTHGNLLVDIRSGAFGNTGPVPNRGLQNLDFQSVSSRDAAGSMQNNPYYGWYWTWLDSSAFQYINVYGITQLRLRFQSDDNDDRGNDYLRFFSGNTGNIADRPQLVIEYYQR